FADTAVIVNEIGAIGLDHTLLRGASEMTQLLENGCVCCTLRDDLTSSLQDLFWQRLHRKIPRFQRLVVETTGLAEPAPILAGLFADALVAERYRLHSVVCTVDCLAGAATLDRHHEAMLQAAVADTVVLTKSDLAASEDLTARLASLNPTAAIHHAVLGEIAPELLLDSERQKPIPNASSTTPHHHHHAHPNVVSIELGRVDRAELSSVLQGFVERYGDKLLRVKGLLDTGDDALLVVQIVRDTIFPETRLAPPDGKRQSSLTFIADGLDPQLIAAAFSRFAVDGIEQP
ncbi:MAG: yjiA 2, partial [Rhodospirillales bacterium]|nr:yjiA 2 [Rhodospirillales bacterium]